MPYAKAVTMIDDLQPIRQINYSDVEIDYEEPQNISRGLNTINYNTDIKNNPFYEEVIQAHPQIQKKIRKFTEPDPYQHYIEDVQQPQQRQQHVVPVSQVRIEQQQPNQIYQLKRSVPASIQHNYLNQNMQPIEIEQHMPVAKEQQLHYNSLQSYGTVYPIINEEFKDMNCRNIVSHIKNCPICKVLYHKNDKIYMIIIIILAILIFLLVWKLNR